MNLSDLIKKGIPTVAASPTAGLGVALDGAGRLPVTAPATAVPQYAADPTILQDGMVWFRSDLTAIKARVNTQTITLVPADGWTAATAALTYSSADSPTFVATTASDLTASIPVGARVKLTQTTVKYFIVTAIDATTITLYGGSDYTLANAAISSVFYSLLKCPVGFPMSPLKWTQELNSTSDRTTATPTSGTWYNAESLSIPIGAWYVEYFATIRGDDNSAAARASSTLSTANNSASDADFTANTTISSTGPTGMIIRTSVSRRKTLVLAAKTAYYLNYAVIAQTGVDSVSVEGGTSPTIIRAVCAYL